MEKKYLLHLTGFRAIAAYFVLITHSVQAAFSYSSFFAIPYVNLTYLANLGMSIFFVLSGFVITYTYYDRFVQLPLQHIQSIPRHLAQWWLATWDFAVARFARLYPLYILCLLGDIHQRNRLIRHATFGTWASFLTLTQSWWHQELFTFTGAWSISTECFFYVCFILWMLPGTARHSETYIRHLTIVTFAGIFLILIMACESKASILTFLSSLRLMGPDIWSWWFVYVSPYVRVGDFIAGVCAARMFMVTRQDEHLPAHQRRANMLCIGSLIAILAITIYNLICGLKMGNTGWVTSDGLLFFLSRNFGYAPFLAYIFYACSRYPNLLTRWCSTRFMLLGGEISYSLYLLQFEIISRVLPGSVAQWPTPVAYEVSFLKAMLYILLTTVAAFASYHMVERPSRWIIRKGLDG